MKKIFFVIIFFFSHMLCNNVTAAESDDFYSQATKFKKDHNLRAYFECCQKAAQFGNASALNELGTIFEYGLESDREIVVLKNLTMAIECYEKATRIDPTFALARENLARARETMEVAKDTAQKIYDAMERETSAIDHGSHLQLNPAGNRDTLLSKTPLDSPRTTTSSLGPSAISSLQATPEKQ